MTFSELKRLLLAEVRTEAAFSFVNTRLILRTGINLNQVDAQLEATGRVEEALREIRAMGLLKEKNR
jgi:hypothetical protein